MAAFDDFFSSLETLPKLLSDIALGVSVAQQRMDVTYLRDLAALMELAGPLLKQEGKVDEFIALFKAIGPSRYQFTETVVEVRADLQMSRADQMAIGVSVPYAVAVNASYARRTASDHRASALIRTVMHAVSADPATMQTLLNAAKEAPGTTLPDKPSPTQSALQEALSKLAAAGPAKAPAARSDAGGDAKKTASDTSVAKSGATGAGGEGGGTATTGGAKGDK